METCEDIVCLLKLKPHPEGGFYAQVVEGGVRTNHVEPEYHDRPCFSHIYYCLAPGDKSRIHRLDADEMFHHYIGSSMTINELRSDGQVITTVLGKDLRAGESLCHLVPAGTWFRMSAQERGSFSLVGCTVSPSFRWDGLTMGSTEELRSQFPQCNSIESLS